MRYESARQLRTDRRVLVHIALRRTTVLDDSVGGTLAIGSLLG